MRLHPTILESDGKPAFVVLPYSEYLALTGAPAAIARRPPRIPADGTIPHEVVTLMTSNGWSIVRSWREYLGITQVDMAARLGIRQPSYAAMESADANPRRSTRERIAAALGVHFDQIDV
ncbi:MULTISPECIES: helix-turn-helix transcriptional regulator [Achromobacter]|uniref:helix-turn-helix transcriptional regulator n=1 Tax=Achromobacter sp. TaxID=134375 RepID=UPI002F945776